METKRREKFDKVCTTIGAYLIFFSGRPTFYWGNLSIYVMSYIYHYDGQNSIVQPHWILAIYNVCWSVSALCVWLIADRVNSRLLIMFGIVLNGACFLLSFYMVKCSLATFIFTFGTFIGLANGVYEGLVLKHFVIEWSTDDSATLTSIVYSAAPTGAILTNVLITWYVNPTDLSPDVIIRNYKLFSQPEVRHRIPSMFAILGMASFSIQLTGFCLLRHRTESPTDVTEIAITEHEELRENGAEAETDQEEVTSETRHLSLHRLLRRRDFYKLLLVFFLSCVSRFHANVYYKLYGEVWIHDDHFLTVLSMAVSVGTSLSMLFWGMVLNYTGTKHCLMTMFALVNLCLFLMYFFAMFSKWAYFLVTTLCLNITDTFYLCFTLLAVKWFGQKDLTRNIALLNVAPIVTTFIGAPCIDGLLAYFGWFSTFVFAAAISDCGFILTTFTFPKQ